MKSDRLLFSARVLLLLFLCFSANGVQASGTFQRTRDGKAIVWNTDQQPGDEAEWSGDADERGYAKGAGTIIWYKLDRVITGSSIPTERGHSTMIATYSGKMVNGMLAGVVETVDANGERVHATFAAGRRKTDWTPGPAATTAAKKKKAAPKTEEPAAREVAATRPTVPPAKIEPIAETKPEPAAASDETDRAQTLTAPPSSIHIPDKTEQPSATPAPASSPTSSPSS